MANELRFVGCQVALVCGALAVGQPWPVATALGAVATTLFVISVARVRGEWLSAVLAARLAHHTRRRTHDVGSPEHEPEALFDLLAPEGRLLTAELGDRSAGVLSGPSGLVVVLRPDLRPDLLDFAVEGITGRLVLHAGPVRDRAPRGWLAIRAERDCVAFDDDVLLALLTNTVRRRFKKAELLSGKDVRSTVVALTHTGSGRGLLHESWAFWRAGSVVQSGFRLAGFDGADAWPLLRELLDAAPGVALTAAVTTGPGGGAVLRVAATTHAAITAAAAELSHVAAHHGVRLERLDGRHASAVAATLPIGGGSL